MVKFLFILLCSVTVVATLTGCASVERRIEKNLTYFNELPADAQEKIRNGQIDIGFEKPMVEMALGRPATIKQRKTVAGTSDVWVYNGVRTEWVYPNCSPFGFGAHYAHYGSRRYGHGHYHHLTPIARPRTYEQARVVFEDGKVKEVEQRKPRG